MSRRGRRLSLLGVRSRPSGGSHPDPGEVEAGSSLAAPLERLDGDSVLRNASFLAAATVVARLCTFGLAAAMARALGAAGYGRYGLAVAVATIVMPVVDAGLTPYVTREAARARDEAESLIPRLVGVKLALGAVGVIAVLAGARAGGLNGGLIAALGTVLVATLADSFSSFVFGYFQGRERMAFEATSTVVAALARSVGGIVVVVVVGRLMAVLAWILAVSIVQSAHAAMRLRAALRASAHHRAGRTVAPIAWRTAAAMGMVTVFAMVYLRADSVVIGSVLDERSVGWYSAAYALTSGMQIVPWMIAVALLPVFVRAHGRDPALFESSWHTGMRAVLLVSLPLSLVACVLARPIVVRLFGAGFSAAAPALSILVWSSPLWAVNMALTGALRGAGREAWLWSVTGAGAVVNVGLNLWAVPALGIEGAAAVTVATEATVLAALWGLALRRGILPWPRLPHWQLALALASLGGVALVTRTLPVEVSAPTSLAAYVVTLAATGVLTRDDVDGVRAAFRAAT